MSHMATKPAAQNAADLLLDLNAQARRLERLDAVGLIGQGIGVREERLVDCSPFVNGPRAIHSNKSDRVVGVSVEVTRAGGLGATIRVGKYAPLPADVVGGRAPVSVLLPNESLDLIVTDAAVQVLVRVVDPFALVG